VDDLKSRRDRITSLIESIGREAVIYLNKPYAEVYYMPPANHIGGTADKLPYIIQGTTDNSLLKSLAIALGYEYNELKREKQEYSLPL
jgi:hypothetical protein